MNYSIKTCIIENCEECDISSKTNCIFRSCQLLEFYLISVPSFLIGGLGLYKYSASSLFIWLSIVVVFFFVIEIRVLCTHCPHYENSNILVRCWANSGAPKLWSFRPWPMNLIEKSILIAGFIIVWGYPLMFFLVTRAWLFLLLYSLLTALFFTILTMRNCIKCINFSCPLNRIDKNTKETFLRNNPIFINTKK